MSLLQTVLLQLNTYRIHVIVVFALLLISYITPFLSSTYAPYIPHSAEFYGVVFSFTLLWAGYYIGNKYFDYKEDAISQAAEARRSPALAYAVTAMYILPLPWILWLHLPLLPYLALIGVTLGYSITVAGVRIKNLFLIKNLYAAGSWWMTIAVAVAFYTNSGMSFADALRYTYDIFLLLMVFELLWDIRDIEGDKAVGNMTVPVVLGITMTKLIIFGCIGLIWWWNDMSSMIFSILFFNVIYLALVTIFVKKDFPNYYYHSVIYIEGLFLLSQILIYY